MGNPLNLPNPYTVNTGKGTISNSNWDLVVTNSLASHPPLDPIWVGSVILRESGGNPNAINDRNTNGTVDAGLMQVNSANWAKFGLDAESAKDPSKNIAAGVAILAGDVQRAGGDYQVAQAMYRGGNAKLNPANWNDADKAYVADISNRALAAGSTAVTGSVSSPGGGPKSSPVATDADLMKTAVDAQALTNLGDQVDYNSLTPQLFIKEGLDSTPWFSAPGMLTGNPRIRSFVTPVSFRMLIREWGNSPLLSKGNTGTPVELQLNASVKSFNKTSKHVVNKENSRTGIHLTMWGQQADMIEAQCTTGVFMNQLGLTDFMSTSSYSPDLIQLISSGFAHTTDEEGEVQIATQTLQKNTTETRNAFRVAAQDAFVELLSLFKCNGNIWFHKDNYTGTTSGQDQTGVAAWSPAVGASNLQGNARNNDVMSRGYIAMQLKDSTYLGFFKSLSWNMDANSPFKWDFNFVFQVERTVSLIHYPR